MLSLQIIEDRPFAVANKSSTLEKIKDELRQRTSEFSDRNAFNNFWDRTYLESNEWQQEIAFSLSLQLNLLKIAIALTGKPDGQAEK